MQPMSPVVRVAIVAGMLLTLLALYWSTVSYHYGGDGLLFAGSVEAVRAGNYSQTTLLVFFHAHHVLYGPAGLLVHAPWDPATSAVTTMAMGNGVLAVLTCWVFFLLARAVGATKPGAFLAAATLAVSFAFWFFAVYAETYMLAQFGAVVFCWLAARRRAETLDTGAQFRSAVALSFVWVLAIGGHIVNVLLIVPLIVWELAQRRRVRLLATVTGGALATLAVYLVAMRWTGAPWTVAGLIDWIRPQGDYVDTSAAGVASTLSALALGIGPGVLDTFWSGPWLGLVLLAAAALLLRRPGHADRAVWRWLVAWFLTYLVFFSVWDAGNIEFSLWLVVPLLLSLACLDAGLAAGRSRHAWRAGWVLLIIVVAATNYTKEIGPHRDPATNIYLQIAHALSEKMGPSDLLLISGVGPSARYKFYLPYFSGRTSYGLRDRLNALGETGLRAELDTLRESVARGERRMFCLPELFGPEGVGEIEASRFPRDVFNRLRNEFLPAGRLVLKDGQTVDLQTWVP